jgi:Domain of unknown function DUF29
MTIPNYGIDFYAWTQAQAAALRSRDWAALDLAQRRSPSGRRGPYNGTRPPNCPTPTSKPAATSRWRWTGR